MNLHSIRVFSGTISGSIGLRKSNKRARAANVTPTMNITCMTKFKNTIVGHAPKQRHHPKVAHHASGSRRFSNFMIRGVIYSRPAQSAP